MSLRIIRKTLLEYVLLLISLSFCLVGTHVAAAELKAMQSGTTVMPNGSTLVTTVSITPVVDDKTFIIATVTGSDGIPGGTHVTSQLSNCSGTPRMCDQIQFQRNGTGGTSTIHWYVAEFNSGVTVQRGTLAHTSMSETSPGSDIFRSNIPLNAVDTTKAFPLTSERIGGIYNSDDDFTQARLPNSTSLELTVEETRSDGFIAWQVVEYQDANVQTGDLSFSGTDTLKTATLPTAINPSKSWLVYNFRSEGQMDPSTNPAGQNLVRGLIDNATTLSFDRDLADDPLHLSWFLIEFTDDTLIQHQNAHFTTTEAQKNITLPTATELNYTMAVGGYHMRGGKSSVNTANLGAGWFTLELTSPTNLRISRETTESSTADLGWFTIEFAHQTALAPAPIIATPPTYNVCESIGVEQLDAFQYTTATGAGAAGIPSMSYTAPSGSNRFMLVLLSMERDHSPLTSRGDNFESNPGVTFPSVTFGGAVMQQLAYSVDSSGSSNNFSDAEVSRSYYLYGLFDLSIPSGIQNIQVGNINSPTSVGDDAILAVATFANVGAFNPAIATGTIDRTAPFNIAMTASPATPNPATDQPPGTNSAHNMLLAFGSSSKPETLTIDSAWDKLVEISVANTAGGYASDPARVNGPFTENDGHALLIQGIKGVSADQTAIMSSAANDLQSLSMHLYRFTAHGCDYGDAPSSYGDAFHSQSWSRRIGTQRGDAEIATPVVANAVGDDSAALDDEDGVDLSGLSLGTASSIDVPVAGSAYLSAWIDWDANGAFDGGEQIASDLQDTDADGVIPVSFTVPANATTSQTYARFRWSINTGATPTGWASYGEVEDYAININGAGAGTTACSAQGGTLGTTNYFTELDNGTMGVDSGAADESPATDPYPGRVSNSSYDHYYSMHWGEYSFASNVQTTRNGSQHGNLVDPVYGATGRFFAADPDSQAPVISTTVSGLTAGKSYEIGFYVANSEHSISSPNNEISILVGGTEVYTTDELLPSTPMQWEHHTFVYHAGGSTSLNFALRALQSGNSGNDYLLDNITIHECQGLSVATGAALGRVYLDANGNDTLDSGSETTLENIRVWAYHENGTPADTSDDILAATTFTNSIGQYTFFNLDTSATYRIEVDTNDPDLPFSATIGTSNPVSGVVPKSGSKPPTPVDFGFDPVTGLSANASCDANEISVNIGGATPGSNVDINVTQGVAGTQNWIETANASGEVSLNVPRTNSGTYSASIAISSGGNSASATVSCSAQTAPTAMGEYRFDECVSNQWSTDYSATNNTASGSPDVISDDDKNYACTALERGSVIVPHVPAYEINSGAISLLVYDHHNVLNRRLVEKGFTSGDKLGLYTAPTTNNTHGTITAELNGNVIDTGETYFTTLNNGSDHDTQWVHVMLTFGSQGMKLYINGALKGTHAYTGGISNISENFRLPDISGYYDEFYIFSGQPSDAQVQDIYSNLIANKNLDGSARSCPCIATSDISGTVFEDVNYGGGLGRDFTTANTSAQASGFTNIGVAGAIVELYQEQSGNFIKIADTTTDANGQYSFSVVDDEYRVRLVSDSVASARAVIGASFTAIPVQTYRRDPDAATTSIGNEIGGANPLLADAGLQSNGTDLASIQVQSVTDLVISGSAINSVDFGVSFSTVVNTNDSGQGSLRQFISNSNRLDSSQMAQDLPVILASEYGSGDDVAAFMIPSSALTAGNALITLASSLDISAANLVLDGRSQAANTGSGSIVLSDNDSTTFEALHLSGTADNSAIRYLTIESVAGSAILMQGTSSDLLSSVIIGNNTLQDNGQYALLMQYAENSTLSLNTIRNNGNAGIHNESVTGNTFSQNSVFNNGGLGIDLLGNVGVDSNDVGDADSGANDMLNFPVLGNVVQNGANLEITFDLDTPITGNPYRIEFFDNLNGLDASQYGEGEVFIGSVDVMPGVGRTATLAGVTASNRLHIVATATACENATCTNLGSTSEFSTAMALNYDFGDAPDLDVGTTVGNYLTQVWDDGPRHEVPFTGATIFLGTIAPDTEADGQANSTADGDDSNGTDDEDGVSVGGQSLQDKALVVGNSVTFDIVTQGAGVLNAWIDFNADGDFTDVGEHIALNENGSAGSISLNITIPATASLGDTYARFRYSSTADLTPMGLASDGEVEDYRLTIENPSFDLALHKRLADGQNATVNPGETVTYILEVTNEGSLPASNISLVDYLPGALSLNDPDWTDNGAGIATLNTPIASLAAGATASVDISFTANATAGKTERAFEVANIGIILISENECLNSAEISQAFGGTDTDSTFDNVPGDTAEDDYAQALIDIPNVCGSRNDYGDAPDTGVGTGSGNYQTLRDDNGARHVLSERLYLGECVDNDAGAHQNAQADADDLAAQSNQTLGTCAQVGDDEDGIALVPTLSDGQLAPTVDVAVYNTTGANVGLSCWVDYNGDGVFDNATERGQASVPTAAAVQTVSLVLADVPATASLDTNGNTYLRCRVASTTGADNAVGAAADGEVEDYPMSINSNCAVSASISNVQCIDGGTATADDDRWTFDANVSGSNTPLGSFWCAEGDVAAGSCGSYLTDKILYPEPATISANSVLDLTWVDQNDATCRSSTQVNAPAACSPGCGFTMNLGTVTRQCKNTLTPNDDELFVELSVSGVNSTNNGEWDAIRKRETSGAPHVDLGLFNGDQTVTLGAISVADVLAEHPTGFTLWAMETAYTDCLGDVWVSLPACPVMPTGAIEINKTVDGAAAPANWEFTLASNCNLPSGLTNPVSVPGSGGTASFAGLLESEGGTACTYSITENTQAAYQLDTANSDSLSGISITANNITTVNIENDYIAYDYGDAPDSYGTNNLDEIGEGIGASHANISDALKLGNLIDDESNGIPNAAADGDDNQGLADEEGLGATVIKDGATLSLTLNVTNTTGQMANLMCWLDYNGDGVFANDGSESGSTTVADGSNATNVLVPMPNVPANASSSSGGSSYLRCRLSTDAMTDASATGLLSNGEVEDYQVSIYPPLPRINVGTNSANNNEITEGDSGTKTLEITVSLDSSAPVGGISVDYVTSDGTATLANNDYQAASGTLTIPAGASSGVISIIINGDTTVEADETFLVTLSNAVNATIDTAQATATILNDDTIFSIGNTVWHDRNNDGVQNDGADAGIADVHVELYHPASTSVISTKMTDANGYYLFTAADGLLASTAYELRIIKPLALSPLDDMSLATVNAGTDDGLDSDAVESGNYWQIAITSPSSGNQNTSFDFGFTISSTKGCLTVGSTGLSDEGIINSHPNTYDFNFSGVQATGYCAERSDASPQNGDVYEVHDTDRLGLSTGLKEKLARAYSALIDPDILAGFMTHFGSKQQMRLDDMMQYITWYYTDWNEGFSNLESSIYGNGNIATIEQKDAMKAMAELVINRVEGTNGETQYSQQELYWLWNLTTTSRQDMAVPKLYVEGSTCIISTPQISITDTLSIIEGDSGTKTLDIPVNLDIAAPAGGISVDYSSSDGTALISNNDYQALSGTLLIPEGATSGTITVTINGDTAVEADETFQVTLANPSNATIATGQATITILDDDGTAINSCNVLYICGRDKRADADAWDHGLIRYLENRNASVTPAFSDENAAGLGLLDPMDETTALSITMSDYDAVIVSPTVWSYYTSDLVNTLRETDTTVLSMNMQFLTNMGMANWSGYNVRETAFDEETEIDLYNFPNPSPSHSIVLTYGNYYSNANVSLWTSASDYNNNADLGVFYTHSANSLSYAGSGFNHGKRAFLGYDHSGFYENSTNGGAMPVPEASWLDPSSHLTAVGKNYLDQALSFVSLDNCALPTILPKMSITDASLPESGTTPRPNTAAIPATLDFVVSLDIAAPMGGVSVDFATGDGTATVIGNDYQANSGTLMIPEGSTSATISVVINDDTEIEPDENLFVNLSNPVSAILEDPQGEGVILDDDTANYSCTVNGSSGDALHLIYSNGRLDAMNPDGTAASGDFAGTTVSGENVAITGAEGVLMILHDDGNIDAIDSDGNPATNSFTHLSGFSEYQGIAYDSDADRILMIYSDGRIHAYDESGAHDTSHAYDNLQISGEYVDIAYSNLAETLLIFHDDGDIDAIDNNGNPADTPYDNTDAITELSEYQGIAFGLCEPAISTAIRNAVSSGEITEEGAIEWTLVWTNQGTETGESVTISDEIPAGTVFEPLAAGLFVSPDGVYCEARGHSETVSCAYEAPSAEYPRGRVVWTGSIAAESTASRALLRSLDNSAVGTRTASREVLDLELQAANEIVIRFQSRPISEAIGQPISNQAYAFWDMNGDGIIDLSEAADNPYTTKVNDPFTIVLAKAVQIPVMSFWGLLVLSSLLAGLGVWQRQRRRIR